MDQRDTFVESHTQLKSVNCSEIDAESKSTKQLKDIKRNGTHSESNQSMCTWENSDENNKVKISVSHTFQSLY